MSLHVPGFRQVGSIEKTAGRRATSDERDLVEGREILPFNLLIYLAFHYAKLTGQRSVGTPEENGATVSDRANQ